MTVPRFEHREIEQVARQLCLAGGEKPDRTVRFSAAMSPDQGNEPVVTRQIFMPAWKLHVREATRLVRAGYLTSTQQNLAERKPSMRSAIRLRIALCAKLAQPWVNRALGILRQAGKKRERTFRGKLLNDNNKSCCPDRSMEAIPQVYRANWLLN